MTTQLCEHEGRSRHWQAFMASAFFLGTIAIAVAAKQEQTSTANPYLGKILFFDSRHSDRESSLIQSTTLDGRDLTTILEMKGATILPGRVSPDGKTLAFSVLWDSRETAEAWVLDLDGQHRVVHKDAVVVGWSSDGTALVCYRGESGDFESFLFDLDAQKADPLPLAKGEVLQDMSPDGSLFAVMKGNPDKSIEVRPGDYYPLRQIFLTNSLSSPDSTFITDAAMDSIWPRFSPDGQKIVHYARQYRDGKPWESAIIVDLGTGQSRELISFSKLRDDTLIRPRGAPCWTTDGRYVIWQVTKRRPEQKGDFRFGLIIAAADRSSIKELALSEENVSFWGCIDCR